MDDALQNILELSRDPMLALVDSRILAMNAAARKTFTDVRAGESAAQLIPEPILFDPSVSSICAAEIDGAGYTVSSLLSGGVRLLSLVADGSPALLRGGLSDGMMCGLLSALFNIGLAADLLRSSVPDAGPETKRYFASLYHSYYSVYRRLKNLNMLCSLREGTMSLVLRSKDLVRLCADAADTAALMTRGYCAPVRFESELQTLPAILDAQKVETLVFNLLSNSLRHTPPGGAIRLRLSKSGENALISVDDTGCGIPPERLKTVFNGFLNRISPDSLSAPGGDGLGLGLCRCIAEKHGGTLILESREGEGTSVRVLLPLAPPEQPMQLFSGDADYVEGGMSAVLTELSDVLDESCYGQGFPD